MEQTTKNILHIYAELGILIRMSEKYLMDAENENKKEAVEVFTDIINSGNLSISRCREILKI